jgi:hypothetical protein
MAGLLQPRHWDPNLAPSSMTSSTAASSRSFPLDSATDVTRLSVDQFRPDITRLSQTNDDKEMSPQRWNEVVTTLDLPNIDTAPSSPTAESQKFIKKLGKRKTIPDKQLSELLLPFFSALCSAHPRLLMTVSAPFSRDSVPLDHPSFTFNKTRLPTPRPTFTLGYNPQIFHPHYRELMSGIISDSSGQPRNLDKISQCCQGIYWPFFAVELSNDDRDVHYSTSFARACASAATATCNNALLTLASTLNDISNPVENDPSFQEMLTKSISSFSLAISSSHKSGVLLAHTTSFDGPMGSASDAIEAVATYDLTSESSVNDLSVKLTQILTWSTSTRLDHIFSLLDRFDARVQFRLSKQEHQEADLYGPMDIMQRGQMAPKLAPGQVQMSGGLGRGVSVPLPSRAEMSVWDVLGSTTKTSVEEVREREKKEKERGRRRERLSPTTNPISAKMAGKQPVGVRPGSERDSVHSGSRSTMGTGRASATGERWMPVTPGTPESMKLTLNTKVPVEQGPKSGKRSLFKSVLHDAMPGWSRVEM